MANNEGLWHVNDSNVYDHHKLHSEYDVEMPMDPNQLMLSEMKQNVTEDYSSFYFRNQLDW